VIISISGTPGSGKSTVGEILAKRLGFEHYSMGDFQRSLAQEKGITILELLELEKKDPKLDKRVDEKQRKIGLDEDNFVIDSRLGFHFIPHSVKIFIDASIEARAQRVFKDMDKEERSGEKVVDINDMIAQMKKRQEIDLVKFEKHYSLNPYDHKHYDLVVDATMISAQEVAKKVLEFIQKEQ